MVIDGNTVLVSSPKVAKPVAVRYAYAEDIMWANLFNKDGLPAVTFRTDKWTWPDMFPWSQGYMYGVSLGVRWWVYAERE